MNEREACKFRVQRGVQVPKMAHAIWRVMTKLPKEYPDQECIVIPGERCTRKCQWMKLRIKLETGSASITPVCSRFDPEVAIDVPICFPPPNGKV